ncbi:mitochondrial matrix iron-sulfur protein [Cladophialophora chaetospira]|uniref:Mitochondrial matrix iron-sulfur protein n=1 Tax=Cladophialophora chaetospira TaxID=386627 RepID=A0AA38XP35_9EURO|nr:mitochondrial matrix iron-sulfur protein [Cladophialophora chaetospira]
MSGCRGARSLVGVSTYFRSGLRSQVQSGASRDFNRSSYRNASTITLCRRHQLELQTKKDQIRTHIRALELGRRKFSMSPIQKHGHIDPPKPGEELHVTFIDKNGDEHKFEVSKGDNLLDIAQANDIEMEGACGGSCACSTCHVIVESDEMYDKIPEATDDENDMLDLAFGLTETSRLGCQVQMAKELDGLVVKLPQMTRNMQASDFEKR